MREREEVAKRDIEIYRDSHRGRQRYTVRKRGEEGGGEMKIHDIM